MTANIRRKGRYAITPEALIRAHDVSDRAVRLWLILDRYAGESEVSWPSRQTLAEALGSLEDDGTVKPVSTDTIDRAIRELQVTGWLTVEKRGHLGIPNLYTLQDEPQRPEPGGSRNHAAPAENGRGGRTDAAPGAADVRRGEPQACGPKETSEKDSSEKEPAPETADAAPAPDQAQGQLVVLDGGRAPKRTGFKNPVTAQADAILRAWWDVQDRKPLQRYQACRSHIAAAVNAGHPAEAISAALTTVHSSGWGITPNTLQRALNGQHSSSTTPYQNPPDTAYSGQI